MDEVIDDLISLESGFNDGGLDCMESNLLMQNNVSMKHYYYYSSTGLKCHTLSMLWSSFIWISGVYVNFNVLVNDFWIWNLRFLQPDV